MAPEIMYPILAIVLLLGLIWGVVKYSSRNKRLDPASEQATRRAMSDTGPDGDVPAPPNAPTKGPGGF
jgi:hypothetical protein